MWGQDRRRFARAASLAALSLLAVPSAASAADTFADASRPDDSGDCLTLLTACKTINGAIGKAGAGNTVHVEPGIYAENVVLPGGISLASASGNPTISPATGTAVEVAGGPAATIQGLTFSSNVTNGVQLKLDDGAGSTVVIGNTFVDPTPTSGDQQVGIRTASQGAPQISGNTITGLWHGIEVVSPTTGAPGAPVISQNTISGVHDIGDGVQIVGIHSVSVTGPTSAALVGNLIHSPGAGQQTGVFVLDGGSFAMDASSPTTGVTMARNRIVGGTNGLQDVGARGAVTLDGDVFARVSTLSGGAAVQASEVVGLGGDLTIANSDIVNSPNLAVEIQDVHLTLNSSIVSSPILDTEGSGTATCTITFSQGPTTGGDSCQTFQTSAAPSFVDAAADDYHLTAAANATLIDQGDPAAPPAGDTDFDGDPRAIDADGACPLNPVRDIGADEFDPGIPSCPLPPGGGGALTAPGPTGQRAAALKRCKRKHSKAARKRCKKRAKLLPF